MRNLRNALVREIETLKHLEEELYRKNADDPALLSDILETLTLSLNRIVMSVDYELGPLEENLNND